MWLHAGSSVDSPLYVLSYLQRQARSEIFSLPLLFHILNQNQQDGAKLAGSRAISCRARYLYALNGEEAPRGGV